MYAPLEYLSLFSTPCAPESMAAAALDQCVSQVDSLIQGFRQIVDMDGPGAPRLAVDPDDPWADMWTPPPSVYKVSVRHLNRGSEGVG